MTPQSLLPNEQGKDDGTKLSQDLQPEGIDREPDVEQQAKVQVDEDVEKEQQMQEDEQDKQVHDNNGEGVKQVHDNNGEGVKQVHDNEQDIQILVKGQVLTKDKETGKGEISLPKDEDKDSRQQDVKGKDADDMKGAGKKSDEEVVKEKEKEENEIQNDHKEEVNIHEVKFKTRQEMAIKTTNNPTASHLKQKSDKNKLNLEADRNVIEDDSKNQLSMKESQENQDQQKSELQKLFEERIKYSKQILHAPLNER